MLAARLVQVVALTFLSAALTRTALAAPSAAPPAEGASNAAAARAVPAPLTQRVVGVVTSIDLPHEQVVVSVNGEERPFTFANLAHDPDLRVGATVEVSFTGSTATAIALHEAPSRP